MVFDTDPFLAAAEDQEGLDAVLFQVRVPLTSKSWLHLIVSIKILQGGLSYVDPPTWKERKKFENMFLHVCRTQSKLRVFIVITLFVLPEQGQFRHISQNNLGQGQKIIYSKTTC